MSEGQILFLIAFFGSPAFMYWHARKDAKEKPSTGVAVVLAGIPMLVAAITETPMFGAIVTIIELVFVTRPGAKEELRTASSKAAQGIGDQLSSFPSVLATIWNEILKAFSDPDSRAAKITKEACAVYSKKRSAEVSAETRALMTSTLKEILSSDVSADFGEQKTVLVECMVAYLDCLPRQASPSAFSYPMLQTIDAAKVADKMLGAFNWNAPVRDHFPNLFPALQQNWTLLAKSKLPSTRFEAGDRIWPSEFKGTNKQLIYAYFKNTPFMKLFERDIPLELEKHRFMHQWVLAPTGSGKTQLLQTQIAHDLKKVVAGDASIFVMDSQGMGKGTLLHTISHLQLFAPGQPLHGKLVILEPRYQGKALPLNLFGMAQSNDGDSEDVVGNSAGDIVTFMLNGDSPQQRQMIRYLVRLAEKIPNATLGTIRSILTTPKTQFESTFEKPLLASSKAVRGYFKDTFFRKPTQEAVLARLDGITSTELFEEMFSQTGNAVNLLDDIEEGKVVLINTDKEHLGDEACEAFGRLFMSLLLRATRQRKSKKPVYCYIDECADYISSDTNVERLIDQARKQSVALVFAHQRSAHIQVDSVLDALKNCAIQFAGRNRTDAPMLSRLMQADPDEFFDMKPLTFLAFVQGETRRAITIQIRGGLMESEPQMSGTDYANMRDEIHKRTLVTPQPIAPSHPTQSKWDEENML